MERMDLNIRNPHLMTLIIGTGEMIHGQLLRSAFMVTLR